MIYILHGDEINSSYYRLSSIVKSYPKYKKIKFVAGKNSINDLYDALFIEDLFLDQKIIICENFITNEKKISDILSKIPKEKIIIFWEKSELTPNNLKKIPPFSKIENFKSQPILFHFLDSISPQPKNTLNLLTKLKEGENYSLTWNSENRIFLLILSKLGCSRQITSKIVAKPILDWQWSKIVTQSKKFDLKQLLKLYSGVLDIDYKIKKGETSINEFTLLSSLFLGQFTS